jgi:methylenetetrahydrofolate reductase (NADPH)
MSRSAAKKLRSDAEREALLKTVEDAYMEIFPTPTIESKLDVLEPNSYVAVTCSPTKGVDVTLDMVERLALRGYKVVPHIAAKMVKDDAHLAIAEIDHKFTEIGVAAHPEGHPAVSNDVLLEHLHEKQEVSNYMVTQMCFDAGALATWLRDVRERGITLPAWIGLPGVSDRSTLVTTSLRIGVGDSVRYLKNRGRIAARLLMSRTYRPDGLLTDLAPYIADPAYGIEGHHIYCFNQVERAEQWRHEFLDSLRSRG